jgi:hypothetical protein
MEEVFKKRSAQMKYHIINYMRANKVYICAQMKYFFAQMKCQCAQMKCTAVYIFSYKDIILKCYMLYGSLSKYTHFFLFLFW